MRLTSHSARDLDRILVYPDFSLRQTMDIMSHAGRRFVPVVDRERRLVGVVADGDMRRYIAAGGKLDDPIGLAANPDPIVIHETMTAAAIRSFMMRRGIEALPQLRDGRLEALHLLSVVLMSGDTTVVLMAGGLGSRLAPMTDSCPKPLLPIGGKPILTRIIETLRDQGVRRFIMSVNYLADMLVGHYGDGSAYDVCIDYVHETKRMGSGGALSLINQNMLPDHFLVYNCDLMTDINVAELQRVHEENEWHATMVVRDHSYTIPYGVVRVSRKGDFEGADEKPVMHCRINAGIYMLSKPAFRVIPANTFYDLPTLFTDLPRHGMRGGTYLHGGRWIDVGTMADFKRACAIYGDENT